MMQALQQDFSALTSRDKMKFIRWAAESVGAKLDTVFGPTTPDFTSVQDSGEPVTTEHGDTRAEHLQQNEETEIPEFLKR